MKFLIDAQLPRRLAHQLSSAGYDAIHTLDLPNGNRTSDADIIGIADQEGRIVVTKDDDFVNSFLVRHQPQKLLLISTGNIRNAELDALLSANFATIESLFADHDFIEINRTALIVHS
jgi:predicted nuclease of predicted toxin-antitoxin system